MGTTIDKLLALNLSERMWIRHLPNSLADLVRLIGVEATLKLALHYGGTSAVIPREPVSSKAFPSRLVNVVGHDAAGKLCEHYWGSSIQIPSCLHGNVLRRLRWLSQMERGANEREATQAAGISRSTHYNWKRRYWESAR